MQFSLTVLHHRFSILWMIKRLFYCTFFLSLQMACAYHPKSEKSTIPIRESIQPRNGMPIDAVGLLDYLETKADQLLRDGRLHRLLIPSESYKACLISPRMSLASPMPSVEIAEYLEKSVVVIGQIVNVNGKTPKLIPLTGTGFFVSSDGAVATCYHVLSAPYLYSLVVMSRDGSVWPVDEVIAVDKINDLAVLKVNSGKCLPLRLGSNPKSGTPIWIMSHPQWRYYTVTSGLVSGMYVYQNEERHRRTIMNVTAEFASGSSGGPVVDINGNVVGVVEQTQSLYATPMDPASDLQMTLKTCIPARALLDLLSVKSPSK